MLGLELSGGLGSSPAPGTGTIRTAAFTLIRHTNGTATLTINPQVLLDPSTLQSDLAQDGIPAKVTTGSFCSPIRPRRLLAGRVLPPKPRGAGASRLCGSDRDVQSLRDARGDRAELR